MRFFDHFKAPYDNLFNGDIDSYDYLFLGGYVDRGTKYKFKLYSKITRSYTIIIIS